MKLKRKIIALTMTAVFTISMATTAFAVTLPLLTSGTEKTYGEENTQYKPLSPGGEFGSKYAILPKTDTFTFERNGSEFDDSHNITITWWAAGVHDVDGKPYAMLGVNRDMKTEKLVYGKEYSVYPDEVRDKIIAQEEYRDSMGFSGNYNSISANRNEPIIVLELTDNDLDYRVWWVYQVVDNWTAPNAGGVTANTNTRSWASDSKGWWIQNADGTYLTNSWYQSPESGLWYYMGADGYMLTNTTTPDGYMVNSDGVCIQ